HG
ncbi:Protein of unknown function, partial [Gryllus bimaculatus]